MSQTTKKEHIDISKGTFSLISLPDLNDFSTISYEEMLEKHLEKMIKGMFPIEDSSQSKFCIDFVSCTLGEPIESEENAFRKLSDYGMPLKVVVDMENKFAKTKKKETLNFGLVPKMTERGTFIRKGIERSAIGQNIQAYGILFYSNTKNKQGGTFYARISPERGIYLSISTDSYNHVFVSTNATNKISVVSLLVALGFDTKEKITALFPAGVVRKTISDMCDIHLGDDRNKIVEAVYKFFYRNVAASVMTIPEMKKAIENILSFERFDIGTTGRNLLNKKIKREMRESDIEKKRGLDWEDIVGITRKIIDMNNDPHAQPDCPEHLGNRRIKTAGDLYLQNVARQVYRIRKNAGELASSIDPSRKLDISAADIVYSRSLSIASKDFFDGHTQLVEQRNGVSILETKRTFDASGPGGVSRTQAPVEMRDVHYSQYGRICPVFTPENASVGLVTHPSIYARINRHGFLETPYCKVVNGSLTDTIEYMTASDEEEFNITHLVQDINDKGAILSDRVEVRHKGGYKFVDVAEVDYIDISTAQPFSVAFCLIPGSMHNQVVRNFYGTNMQKQALPCVNPEAPLVGTGFESVFAESQIIRSTIAGEVVGVDARSITISSSKGKVVYPLKTFKKGNEKTFMLWQRPIVSLGDKVQNGQIIAENNDTDDGQIAIGKNVRVAYLAMDGQTYEDSILVSERLAHKDTFTSMRVQKYTVNVRDTKLGPEITTYDIPNVSESRIKNLDEEGIVRVGSIVKPGDYIVGKIAPRGDVQQSPEERLLQSIFGEKARDVKDGSEFLSPGEGGRVIDVQVYTREDDCNLDPNVNKQVRITIASRRSVQAGDKLSNRHGGKGVISRVLPVEDMPYTEDGEPIDIVLSPLGVISRRNPAQLFEVFLGEIAKRLDVQIVVPPITQVDTDTVNELVEKAGVAEDGKQVLYDGRTGEPFKQRVCVGMAYMLKLDHMVADKIHARSVGPHMIVSQQPTGGRARKGGQRFGEMEGWAMTAHGTAYNMREMMTIKSDDIRGRFLAYQSIVNDRPISYIGVPAAFNVLVAYLRGLCMDIQFIQTEEPEFIKT